MMEELRRGRRRGNFVRFGVVDDHICLIVHDKKTVMLCESLVISLSKLGGKNEGRESIIREVLGTAADIARIAAYIACIVEIISGIQ